eukprot:271372-Rhodomonas_salina.2
MRAAASSPRASSPRSEICGRAVRMQVGGVSRDQPQRCQPNMPLCMPVPFESAGDGCAQILPCTDPSQVGAGDVAQCGLSSLNACRHRSGSDLMHVAPVRERRRTGRQELKERKESEGDRRGRFSRGQEQEARVGEEHVLIRPRKMLNQSEVAYRK